VEDLTREVLGEKKWKVVSKTGVCGNAGNLKKGRPGVWKENQLEID